MEGSSLRSISRITGTSINTVTKLLVDAGEACAEFHDSHVVNVPARRVQVDEMWAFVYAKQKHVDAASKAPAGAGDAWTWTALDADSKLIVTWGSRSRGLETAHPFIQDLASRLRGRVQITSDGHGPYVAAVEDAFGADVDFVQLIKLYGTEQTETRYSPAKCLGVRVTPITGDPDPKHINTSYIERQNLNVWMGVRRFTRLTNAFSKKLANHAHTVALFYVWYNWCRRHTTTRPTPAHAVGLTDEWFDAEWLTGVVEAHFPKPEKPGPKPRSA